MIKSITVFCFVFLLLNNNAISQKINFGPTIGLNLSNLGINSEDSIPNSESLMGYNYGLFGRIYVGKIFLQPEIVYSLNRSSITVKEITELVSENVNLGNLTSTLFLGYKTGSLKFMGGPFMLKELNNSLKNGLNNYFDLSSNSEKLNIGFQLGAGIVFSKKLNLDLRYQRSFSNNNYKYKNINEYVFSGNLELINVQFGYSLF